MSSVKTPSSPPQFLKSRKRMVLFIGLVVAAIAGWMFFGKSDDSSKGEVRYVTADTGTIEDVVTAQGKLEPKEYVDVGTQVSGQLKKLHVDIGDNAKKGDLLAEIDPRLYESRLEADTAQLKSLQAQLAEQQANLVLAKQQQARNAELVKNNAISKDAYDQSTALLKATIAKVNTQKAQVEEIESTIKGDQTNLEYTKIYAPMDGTVATLPTREGQTLNASQTAPTVLQIANLDTMTVRAQVAEADVMRLKEGMPVYFTTLGNMDKRWEAKIRQILPSPEVINDVVLYDVLIDVDNKERKLMNGMSTQVFFVMGRAENVVVLPLDALGRRTPKEDNDTGKAYTVKLKDGGTSVIHVGLTDRTNAEIKSGLNAGDVVSVTSKKPSGNNASKGQGGQRGPGGVGGGPRL